MKTVIHILFDADSWVGRISCAILYALFYDFMYKNVVYYFFSYMTGLDYEEMSIPSFILWLIISILPMAFHHRIEKVTTFICLFMYLFIYIPFVHGLFTSYGISNTMLYSYCGVLCMLFVVYFCIGKYHIALKDIDFKPSIPFVYIEWCALLITILFIAVRGSSMHFVNIFTQLDILYELREENAAGIGSMGFIVYLQGSLFGAFYPFLLICYLNQKAYSKTALVLLGYFLLFMVDMQKITFLMPFALIGLYYLIKVKEKSICERLHSYIIIGISVLSFLLYFLQENGNELLFTLLAILLLRTVCVAGWLTQMYYHFFQENPYTYYSHINVINAITNAYPYDRPLGRAVAYGTQNANANMFLTDGMAAAGLPGILIIGIVFLMVLLTINSISYKYKNTDLFVIILPALSFLLNISLFTAFLSEGLILLLLLLLCTDSPVVIKEVEESQQEII